MCYLRGEFLVNCREAQDESKTFHYPWFLLSIVLVAWELPEDNQFPLVVLDLPEVAKFASLWVTKGVARVKDARIFWVLMEASIHTVINHKPRLSSTVFEQLSGYVEFKANFHCVSVRVWKDLKKKWYDIPYLAMDDATAMVLESWPSEWRTTSDLSARSSNSAVKQEKREARLKIDQLADRRKKEYEDKAKAEHIARKQAEEEEEEEEHDSDRC